MNPTAQPTACVSIKLVPNPITDYFQITGIDGKALVSISDLNCFKHLEKQITDDEAISVSSLRKGVYIAKISTSAGIFERKLVKL